jgi:CRP-like cAMP-binding protein
MLLGNQMPVQPDIIETLTRSELLADMTVEQRRDLALRFEVRPFSSGQTLIAAGGEGRSLMELLAGTANVFVREDGHRYKIAHLEPGNIAGEGAFFSGDSRGADVVGASEGMVAVLPYAAYKTLAAENKPAAMALERAVLVHLERRVLETNARLSALLASRERGKLTAAFNAIFGIAETAPVLDHG